MSVVKMKRISICGMRSERKAVLEHLQHLGIVQVESIPAGEDLEGRFSYQETAQAVQQFRKTADRLDLADACLQQFAPVKTSLLSSLAGKKPVTREEFYFVVDHRNEILADVSKMLDLKKSWDDDVALIGDLKGQIEALVPWMELDIPLSWRGTGHVRAFIGSFGFSADEAKIGELLAAEGGADAALPDLCMKVVSREKNMTALTVLCHKNDEKETERLLRSAGFTDVQITARTTPKEAAEAMEARIAELEEEKKDLAEKIAVYKSMRENIRILSDYFRIRSQKYETIGRLPQTENVFVLTGYIPANRAERVQDFLQDHYLTDVEIEDLAEDEEAPVLLKNNPLAESVEGVLSSYGLPAKHDIDPTAIMYWFYVIFFGLMLSDAAYGLIMTVACAAVLIAFPRMGRGMRKSMKMFLACGISTAVWGVLFGGFFGDLITVISTTFFGHPVSFPALWFVPLNDPMRMLIYSLLFGIIHLYFGLSIKGYMCLRDRRIQDFVGDVLSWFLFVSGLILMLVSSDFFYGIAGMQLHLPPMGVKVCIGIAAAGAVLLLLMGGRQAKNPVLRILLGAYEIYGVTSWLSDILSYSRLLALGLATGVIAQVVNQIGTMFGKSVLGVIIFIIVFIFGHTLNFAINALGAYVHTNRLQYVEFFGKFYESGGTPFKPFFPDTKYVEFESKEE